MIEAQAEGTPAKGSQVIVCDAATAESSRKRKRASGNEFKSHRWLAGRRNGPLDPDFAAGCGQHNEHRLSAMTDIGSGDRGETHAWRRARGRAACRAASRPRCPLAFKRIRTTPSPNSCASGDRHVPMQATPMKRGGDYVNKSPFGLSLHRVASCDTQQPYLHH